jgi:two-component system, cell cycle response regulator
MSKRTEQIQRKRRVLVAEDDPASRTLLQRQLERAGYEVVACVNGQEALSVLTESGADIVVADWLMPEMTGVELSRAVSDLRATQVVCSLYFILLTAYTEKAKVVEALEAGADEFLRKPYDLPELLARIRAGERILQLQEELIGRQLELSKSNAQLALLNRKLTRLANTDAMTGLPSRRYVLERLESAWTLAERRGRPLSCIMLDADFFKRINDTYGHKVGDLTLQQIASIIRLLLRRYDVCGRFGGEEFLIMCPEETAVGAASLAERIRRAVAEQPINADGLSVTATVSFGVASARRAHASFEALIAEADAMLYAAKHAGRNQVWYADSEGQGHRFDPTRVEDAAAVSTDP